MRPLLIALLTGLALLHPAASTTHAARDVKAEAKVLQLELLVLEVRNCGVCGLVKDNLQPVYAQTPHARTMPMRFVDITKLDEMSLGLKEPVRTLPTIVLMRNGQEVDRIVGYVAPDMFFRALGHMVEQAQ